MFGAHVGHSTSGTRKLCGDWGIVVGWPWAPSLHFCNRDEFSNDHIPGQLHHCQMVRRQRKKWQGRPPLDLPTWNLDIYLIALSSLGPGSGE